MKEEQIKEMVIRNYNEGFHCAESIANTMNELFPKECTIETKATSGFCGGIGRCKQDICGALSGGIIALGFMYGREQGSSDISKLVCLSAELRQLFLEEFKSTVCKDLIENLQTMTAYNDCKDITAKTSWMLYNLIKNNTL